MDAVMRVKNGATSRPMESKLVARLLLFVLATSGLMFAKTSAQSSGNCTLPPVDEEFVDFDTLSYTRLCFGTWTMGTDLCDLDNFAPYERCIDVDRCTIPREDYFSASPIYFRCRETIYQIKTRPIVNFTVPDFLISGEKMTVVSLVTAVPRPTTFPEPKVELQQRDSEGSTTRENITLSLREVISNDYTYIHFHSFTIRRTVAPNTTVRIDITLPEQTISDDAMIYDDISIIPGGHEPEVTTQPPTTEPVTMATTVAEQPTSTAADGSTPPPPSTDGFKLACPIGSGAVVGAAIGTAVLTSVVSVVATVLIIFCSYKKINQKKHESQSNGFKTSFDAPNSLPLRPINPATVSDYPTPTPSSGNGITPTMETAHLLHSESRRRGTSYSPSRSMSATNRQYSRYSSQASDSPTTTTPNSLAPPTPSGLAPPMYRRMEHNEASAAAAASSPTIVHVMRGTVPRLLDSGAIADGHVDPSSVMPEERSSIVSQDGDKHVYSTIPATAELGQYPPSLRPLPATPPHSNLPSPLKPSHVTVPFDQVNAVQPHLLDNGAIASGHVDPSLLMPNQISSAASSRIIVNVTGGPTLQQIVASGRVDPSSLIPDQISSITFCESTQSASMESPYEKQGDDMKLPHQEGDSMTGTV